MYRSYGRAVLSLIFACVLVASVGAQECPEPVGDWPFGPTASVAVSGNHLFTDSGRSLLIAAVSDPESLQVIASVVIPGRIRGLASAEDLVMIAAGSAGLVVVDVSDPTAPNVVGAAATPNPAAAVAVAAGYVYVAAGDAGLRVFDVSVPSAPVEIGFLGGQNMAGSGAIVVQGGYAYVIGDGGLRVVDVRSPSSPTVAGVLDDPALARALDVAGGFAYVGYGAGLQIVDVRTPTAPVKAGLFTWSGYDVTGVSVAGSTAAVTDGKDALRLLDVSTEYDPIVVGIQPIPDRPYGVDVSGDVAFVAASSRGIRAIDISEPTSPEEVGSFESQGPTHAIEAAKGLAYAAEGNGLRVYDIHNPSSPAPIGYGDRGGTNDFVVNDGLVHIIDGNEQLVIDVSQPSSPALVGSCSGMDDYFVFAVANGFSYTGGGISLVSTDVRNPEQPTLASYNMAFFEGGVEVDGYAYLADKDDGLMTWDISDPYSMLDRGAVQLSGPARSVAAADGFVVVACGCADGDCSSGLAIVDLADPEVPEEVAFLETPCCAHRVEAYGALAFLAEPAGVRVVDFSNPVAPVEVGYYQTQGPATRLAAVERYVVIAEEWAGFEILDVMSCPGFEPSSSAPREADGRAEP